MKLKFTTGDLESHSTDVETSLVSADLGLRTLLRNGQPLYAPDEHARRELVVLQEFDDEVAEHEQLVEAITVDAQADLDAIEDADPRGLDHLDDDVVAVAVNAWLPIAERDVQNMPAGALETRCRALVSRGDERRLVAYAIALQGRVDALRKQFGASDDGEPISAPAAATREYVALERLLQPVKLALIDPRRDQKRKAAEAQLDRARTLRKKIGDAKAKAHRQRERDMAASPFARMGSL
jgi:hypothetical protein